MGAATSPNRLVYQTNPLTQDVRISGSPRVTIKASFSKPRANLSAALISYETEPWGRTDLRIDFAPKRPGGPDAVDLLRAAWDRYRPLIPFYKVRPHHPQMGGWLDWLKAQGVEFED